MAAHYGGAAHDFVVADNVELPRPDARGGMEWEWRVVSLKDIFPEELLALCVTDIELGPEELALPGWSVVSLPRELGRGPVFVYVDAALDGGGGGALPLGAFFARAGV